MNIKDDSADLTIQDGVHRDRPEPPSSIRLHSAVSAAFSDVDHSLTGSNGASQTQAHISDMAAFGAFQSDLGELFYMDPMNEDLFNWSGEFLADI